MQILHSILSDKAISKCYTFMELIGRILPDSIYLRILFRVRTKRSLHLKNPQTFNEKMQWLKLYDHNPLYTMLVDKYAVRKYIEDNVGEEYLIPLVGGPWKTVDEIPFDKLPNQFVLKTTHDCGGVVICKDKNDFDIDLAKRKLKRRLRINYYHSAREWPYKDVLPQIIAEKYMVDESGTELKDYKFMCFNSEVKASFVCSDRFSEDGLKVTFFDRQWKRLPFERCYPASRIEINKPKSYEEMVRIAEVLSKNMPFVRVDFYEIDGKVYLGELTLYPGSGFEVFNPEEWDRRFGDWLTLPNKK